MARGTETEAEEWERGSDEADAQRRHVAEQVTESLLELEQTGSPALIASTVKHLAEAEKRGDAPSRRGAALQLAVAAASYAVAIDLGRAPG